MECQRKILLSNKIKKNFPLTNESLGYIFGWETEEEIFCMGSTASTDHVLLGLEVIGFFCQLRESLDQNELLAICEQKYGSLKLDLENPVVLFVWKENDGVTIIAKSYSSYYATLTDLTVSDIDTNPAVLVRAKGRVPLILEMAPDPDTLKENIELAVEKLRTVFQSQMVAFILHDSNYIVHSSQEESTMNMKELIKIANKNESSENLKVKKNLKKKCPVNFDILLQTSGNAALENNFNHSIVIHCQRRFSSVNGQEWVEQRQYCVRAVKYLGIGRDSWETHVQDKHAVFEHLVEIFAKRIEKYCIVRTAGVDDMECPILSDWDVQQCPLISGVCYSRVPVKGGEFRCISLSVPLDVIVVGFESSCTDTIYNLLQSAVDHQLSQISQCLLANVKSIESLLPVPHHFYPDIWEFPVTIIYPSNKMDKELENYRKQLHKELLLPVDRPFLRKLNACDFSIVSPSGHLINPHESLNPSGVVGGKCAIVFGKYNYHHYMQDHVNDNGWGCAYRSLQTIISWFKYQGYTDRSVPTHTEIQEALVEIGDKPQAFVGSKKWIGSQEVSFCLDHLIQVQSKIMFVSSGAELANKGRELYYHFRDQGTPVMIGGGVLAHTIIGVDFNEGTGDLKFLILDPHYTGSEDLHTVLNKSWCGWKGTQFWDQTAFYNLCLPQRPLEI